MALRFNPPPNWPTPSEGFIPEKGWMPGPAWGDAPEGFPWVIDARPNGSATPSPTR